MALLYSSENNVFVHFVIICRSWSLEVVIRYEDDGHVLSVIAAKGHYMISLIIQNRAPTLLLRGDTVQQVSGPELNESDSVELVL